MAKQSTSQANPLGNVPPHNSEAERATLGALLINKDAMLNVGDIIQADDFYFDTHRLIFGAMSELYHARTPIDVVNLANRLEEKGHLEAIGGRATIVDLANQVPTASHVEHYAGIVQKKSTLRKLIGAAHKMVGFGYQEEDDVESLLDMAEQELFAVSQKYLRNNFVPLNTVLGEAFDRIDKMHRDGGKLRGIPTGFKALDEKLGGLQPSDLVILAARPSMGKSALMLDIARSAAVKGKVGVGIISLEMSKEQIIDRLLCAEADVDMWKLRSGKLSDSPDNDDFPRIGEAMGILSEAPLFIDDSASANVMEIRTKARRLQMEHGLGLLIIDYLQLMHGRANTDNRTQEVSEISRELKRYCSRIKYPCPCFVPAFSCGGIAKPTNP